MQYQYLTALESSSLRELLSSILEVKSIYINILTVEDTYALRVLADVLIDLKNPPTIILAGHLDFFVLEMLSVLQHSDVRIIVLNTATMFIDIRTVESRRAEHVIYKTLSTTQCAELITNGILILEPTEITSILYV